MAKLDETFKTLMAVELIVSEKSPLSSVTERIHSSIYRNQENEFYRRDEALSKLALAYFRAGQSKKAITAAQQITNHKQRNCALWNMVHQLIREDIKEKPKEFNRLIRKAEQIAVLLDDKNYQRLAYWDIASAYSSADTTANRIATLCATLPTSGKTIGKILLIFYTPTKDRLTTPEFALDSVRK